jgi:hypothetical protein
MSAGCSGCKLAGGREEAVTFAWVAREELVKYISDQHLLQLACIML